MCGTVASAFLPETLHQRLPDTVEDAEEFFGREQKFWSFGFNEKELKEQMSIRSRRKSVLFEKEMEEITPKNP